MAQRTRTEERFAEEVLQNALGIEVTRRDDGSAHRMPDAFFRFADGREGALEVTTIGERGALEREAIAAKTDWRVEGARWAWMVHFGRGVVMRELKRHLPTLVLACEETDVPDPALVPRGGRIAESFEWLEGAEVSIHGCRRTNRPGAIDVLPDGGGGAAYEHLEALPQWLASRLRAPDLDRKVEKLKASGRRQLHLFLRIHDSAMPFSMYSPLAWGDYVPTEALDPPRGLTGLWLAPEWENPILWWSASAGWARAGSSG